MPYLRVCPGATRVPSGYTTTPMPDASRSRPCATTWFTAECPALRLIAIGLYVRTAQPTIGIQVTSRFSSHEAGGTMNICAMVSQAEECFQSDMKGRDGRFSRPSIE